MKREAGKKITMEVLAGMVARGFADADQKLEKFKTETEENFKKVWRNFDEVDIRFENIEDNFKKVRNDILEIGDKFVPWNHFDAVSNRLSQLEHKPKNSK